MAPSFQATIDFQPLVSSSSIDILIAASTRVFHVSMHSQALIAQPAHGPEGRPLHGLLRRVRIIVLTPRHRTKTVLILRYLAPIDCLTFDPGRWEWRPGEGFFSYTAKKAETCGTRGFPWACQLQRSGRAHVPPTFVPNWEEIWRNDRPRKKACFMWSLLHKAIAVNEWRHHGHNPTSAQCVCCSAGVLESLKHCF